MNAQALIPLIVQISLILIVAAVGLQSRWRDLEYTLERPALLVRGIFAVNVVVPAVAVVLALLLPLDPAVKAGLVIMAVSPLAPFVPGKLIKAGAEASVVVGTFFALILLAILIVPASLVLLSAIFPADASLPVGQIAFYILTSVLLPLVVGLLVGSLLPSRAAMLAKIATGIGFVLLLPVLLMVLYMAGGQMLAMIGDGTLLAIVVTVSAGLAAGHLLGGPKAANRMALASVAATRHPGIAGLIAHRNFDDRRVMVAVFLFLLVGVVVSAIYQAWAKKQVDEEALIIEDSRQAPVT